MMTTGELWISVFTILAILTGPCLAIIVARKNDDRRAKQQRKFDIFQTLMRTRRLPIHQDHVTALNLVEVEFIEHREVIQAWKDYLQELSKVLPSIEETDRFHEIQRQNSFLTKLISEISKVLKIEGIEQIDILEGNYIPQGWHDDDWEQRLIRRGLVNVVFGKTPIIIQSQQPQQSGLPYPPPPPQDHHIDQALP